MGLLTLRSVILSIWVLLLMWASGALGWWSARLLFSFLLSLAAQVVIQELADVLVLLRRRREVGIAMWSWLSWW